MRPIKFNQLTTIVIEYLHDNGIHTSPNKLYWKNRILIHHSNNTVTSLRVADTDSIVTIAHYKNEQAEPHQYINLQEPNSLQELLAILQKLNGSKSNKPTPK